jgi:AraC-like DNA-binding protein
MRGRSSGVLPTHVQLNLPLYEPWRKKLRWGGAVVQPFYRPLFVLSCSDELEANLRQAIERPFALHRVSDWPALKESLQSASGTAVCFVDGMASVGSETGLAEGLREVARDFPLVGIVACVRVDSVEPEVLSAMQAWGVTEILDLDWERSAAAVGRRIDDVKGVWAQRLFARALPRVLSARGRTLLETAAEVAAQGGHVPELAATLGIYQRTVRLWCAAAGVPEARRMFTWIRLLLAAELLDNPGRTIENVARVSGFASGASLKSTTRAFTGLTPSELRDRGAFEAVASLARAEFRSAREAARQSERHENSWFN